ncbi:MAG: acetolactate synthase small subunit [Candidatus Marinimicrobia bacterium]|nr:acetolactate synthase small subunit [Candidatus Neomarinimicrobiota bacterium]|tara:strand:- start:6368 stop:6844 length:477 start_codon:yes stop_codon:yes gene_type:complete
MKQTYVVIVEDTPGALNRIVNQFRRRNINIQSLAVAPCEQQNISRVTIVVNDIPDERQEIYAQTLKNLVDVIEVQSVYGDSHIIRENLLVKFSLSSGNEKNIRQLAKNKGVSILEDKGSSFIIEAMGTSKEIDNLLFDLDKFENVEFVRSGSVAISRH